MPKIQVIDESFRLKEFEAPTKSNRIQISPERASKSNWSEMPLCVITLHRAAKELPDALLSSLSQCHFLPSPDEKVEIDEWA